MNMTKLRKTLGQSVKALVSVSLLLAASVVTASRSNASATEDIISRYFNTQTFSDIKLGGAVAGTGNNTAVATTTVIMQLFYEGANASANITLSAGGCLTFFSPEGTVDSTIGTATCGQTGGSYDLTVSTVQTLGQLCDLINSQGIVGGLPQYDCTLIGGIRSDIAQNYLPVVSEALNVNNLKAVGGYMVPTSTAALMSVGIIPGQNRHVALNYCAVNSAGTPSVQVYGVKSKDASGVNYFGVAQNDSALAWLSPALTANTTTNEPVATAVPNNWIEFAGASGNQFGYKTPPVGNSYNGHVVVRVNNYGLGATLQAATNFIACNWIER